MPESFSFKDVALEISGNRDSYSRKSIGYIKDDSPR